MRNLITILVFVLAISSCQTAKDKFAINGSVAGVETGKVYLQKLVDGKPQSVDTTDVVDGKFTFKGKMEMPDIRFLRLNEKDYFAQFFLDNANITVKANKDSLRNTKITGSPTQDIFQIYISEMEKLNKDVIALQQSYQTAMSTGNTNEAEKAKIDYQAMIDNNKVYTKNFVKEHSNSVVSAYIAMVQLASQVDGAELDSIVSRFSPEVSNSEYVVKLKEIVEEQKKTSIGAVAPDFTMNDPEGKPIQLSSLQGQIVLVDFWASWCAPCRQENPNVVKLYEQYHDKGFEIIGVSLDRTKEEWVKAIKDDKLNWIHVSDLQFWQNSAAQLYGVNSIPQSFLLDKEGKIIGKGLRGEELAKKLNELFPD
ncbi:MAG TPA: TlpA disulfide reductase family protein [Prolixibacteraceae bacterium]|nr:TlpA disulfide reductase family protein [Prolixibacteraceae bacterium]